jgi:hypothetical protein
VCSITTKCSRAFLFMFQGPVTYLVYLDRFLKFIIPILKEGSPNGMLFWQEGEPQHSHIAIRVGLTDSKVSTYIDKH